MKVDCHCHILPGLDDGAQTLEDSVFLAGKLVEWGYRRAVCTSHSSFLYRNTPTSVKAACELLQAELKGLRPCRPKECMIGWAPTFTRKSTLISLTNMCSETAAD